MPLISLSSENEGNGNENVQRFSSTQSMRTCCLGPSYIPESDQPSLVPQQERRRQCAGADEVSGQFYQDDREFERGDFMPSTHMRQKKQLEEGELPLGPSYIGDADQSSNSSTTKT